MIAIARLLSLLIVLSASALHANAQTYSIDWWSIDCGAYTSASGGGYNLNATLGQHDAGVLTGGGYTVAGGFMPGTLLGAPAPCPGDTNGDRRVNLRDLADVLSTFGQFGTGLTGDVDADDDVDLTDLAMVLGNFGVTC